MRTSWSAVPDRDGHAYNSNPDAAASRSAAAASDQEQGRMIMREEVPVGPIQGTERYYTVTAGDRLYQIADNHGASLYWIIKRNDLSDLPYTGQRLIVPGPAIR